LKTSKSRSDLLFDVFGGGGCHCGEGRGGGIEIFIWREILKSRYKCEDIHCEIFATKFSQWIVKGNSGIFMRFIESKFG
jgi:hypothetical protein